jgi:chromosome segregation ATPase
MEAVQESTDALASLEERINRAVQVVTHFRTENEQLQQQLKSNQSELGNLRRERDEAQALLAEFQKENGELGQKVKQLSEELDHLRGERKQVKTRIEKLLNQLDLLSAS